MPAFNAEKYILAAIESILNQTYKNIELLIFDDCSTDATIAIIESFTDKRIKLIKKNKNTGYTNSLIDGIEKAQGIYIARMDSDDISVLSRIEKQVSFLEGNKEYGIVGSYIKTIDTDKKPEIWKYPITDEKIKCYTIANSPFAHPSVLIRKEVLMLNKLNYNVLYEPCEDYKLWLDLLKVSKGYNLPEVLVYYRLHPLQTIVLKQNTLIEISNKIRCQAVQNYFSLSTSQINISTHYYFFNEIKANNSSTILQKQIWKNTLLAAINNNQYQFYITQLVQQYWVIQLKTLTQFKFSFLKMLSNKIVLQNMSGIEIIKFITKCVINYNVKMVKK
jgi:glycosyltransferase involved in cell wall biosynthesis